MTIRISWLCCCGLLATLYTHSQKVYSLDASRVSNEVKSGYFNMGDPGPADKKILVNSRYITIGGKPVIPVMGELQYSRMPAARWRDEILKMKACGVTVIATYAFWNHHEEIEGQFDWSGDKDLRSFVKLCQQLGVWVYPRIGPWAHGEARNGGTPDWILRKKFLVDRSNDPVYQSYVEKYFFQIGLELKGLMYKDGGPVIGIQLENEYWKGKAGEPHISWLKQVAKENGMDVPLYTVTGWGDGSVPPNEVIPLWGGYPDESWAPDVKKIAGCGNFQFDSFRDDVTIGNAQVKKKDKYMDYSLDPYFTCELGLGIFNSLHRRPVIGALDGPALVTARIGSGGNLLGYYIFAGGSNPLGVYSTLEENKDETGYWSALSPISYDFQAPIRENGLPAPSYYESKKMNYFLDEFGELLAPMEPAFGPKSDNDLQYAVRVKGNSGFLFGINYCRNGVKTIQRQVSFQVKLKDQVVRFPSNPINIPDSSLFIWPFNLDMNGVLLRYATAQPFCKVGRADSPVWVFFQNWQGSPEFCFEAAGIEQLSSSNGRVVQEKGVYIVSGLRPGEDCILTLKTKNGQWQKVLVLTNAEAGQTWLLDNAKGEKRLFLSKANLYRIGNELAVMDTLPELSVKVLKNDVPTGPAGGADSSLFVRYDLHQPRKEVTCILKPQGALSGAEWLVTSVASVNADNELYHKEFQKEFSVGNPSNIKSARLILAPESECRFRINDKWCEQVVKPGEVNVLDITGYVQKGDNIMLIDFPFVAAAAANGKKAFAARVLIEYFNSDRLDFSTDRSWLMTDLYYFPATYGSKPVYPLSFTAPEKTESRFPLSDQPLPDRLVYMLPLSDNYLEGLNNLYLAVQYRGDRIAVRSNNKLIADNLNNNTGWLMDLRRAGLEGRDLQLELRPWQHLDKMYFDIPPAKHDEGRAAIEAIRLVPEYRVLVDMP